MSEGFRISRKPSMIEMIIYMLKNCNIIEIWAPYLPFLPYLLFSKINSFFVTIKYPFNFGFVSHKFGDHK